MDNEKKRILTNTAVLYVRLALSMLISLVCARIVLEKLGVADYGISSLIIGTISFFMVFNSALTQSIQRFLTFSLGQNDFQSLKKVYSISQAANFCLALLVLVLAETAGELLFYGVLKIPAERMVTAQIVFQISAVAVVFTILVSPLDALIVSFERFSFYAAVSIIDSILRLCGTILLCFIAWDKLIFYSLVNLGVIVSVYFIKMFYCRIALPGIVTFHLIRDKKLFGDIFSFSGWNLLEETVTIVNRQFINIVNNVNFGVVINAALGISDQVTSAVFMFINNFQMAFAPSLTKNYAAGEKEHLLSLLVYTTKVSFFLLSGTAVPLILNIDFILRIWLKKVPSHTGIFITISLLTCFLHCLAFPIICAAKATGDIKKYQICANAILSLNIPLCCIVFIVKAPVIPLCAFAFVNLICVLWRIIWLPKMIPYFRWFVYLRQITGRCGLCLLVFVLAIGGGRCLVEQPLTKLVMSVLTTVFLFPSIIFYLGLTGEERSDLVQAVKIFAAGHWPARISAGRK